MARPRPMPEVFRSTRTKSSKISWWCSGAIPDPESDTLTYLWEFGDGTTGSGQSPTHVYSRPGRYTVTLVMFSGVGSAFPGAGAGPVSTQSLTVTG